MKRLFVIISVGLLSAVQAMSQGVSLGLASGSGSPGSTVSIDLNLTDPASDLPASLEWTLNYSTSDFSSATFSTGAAGSGASKSLLCSSPTAGSVTCVLSGQNSTSIANGAVATLSLVVANSTSDSSSALQLTNSDASDATGSSLPVSAIGATVTIAPPALNGFSCNPVSITPPATATCNIALTGSAPTGGASIAMSASPADITFPAVVIPAGSNSTTFSISSSTVASSTPVTLTASYAGANSTFTVTVLPQAGALASVAAPASIVSGQTGSGTVTLTAAAPSGGAVVGLSSSNTSAAQVPSSVTVAAGSTSATFTITAGTVSAATTVTFTASYSGATATATATITPSTLPVISSATSATATVGSSFSYQIAASNSPTSYSATGLPVGLSINTSSGLISGTPTAAGSYTVTLSANNNSGTGTAKLSLTINAALPVISSATTATAIVGTAFSYQITASNSPTRYNATGLPAGLSVNTSSGLISGTATAADSSATVTLSATNSSGTGTAALTLTVVNRAAPTISSAATATATVGEPFRYQVVASNSPTSYSAAGLPSGLSINASSGLISGTPTAAGAFTITLSASNSGGTGSAQFMLTVVSAVSTPISFVQQNAKGVQSVKSMSIAFPSKTKAGDVILVAFDYVAPSVPVSVTDSQGNMFTPVGAQLTSPNGTSSRVYYANNVKGAVDTVTIKVSSSSAWIEAYLVEYSGVNQVSPIDAQAGATGNAGAVSSGSAPTTVAGDVIFGFCMADWSCTEGSGFTARSTFNSNLIEDMTAGSAGSYAATATANEGWTMQMVALKHR